MQTQTGSTRIELVTEQVAVDAATDTPLQLVERRRRRLALDLHDGPTQALSAALLHLRTMREGHSELHESEDVSQLEGLLESAYDQLAQITHELGPLPVDGDDFEEVLRSYVADFSKLNSIDVAIDIEGPVWELSGSARIALFRIVQEALTNAHRHGHARACRVDLWVGEDLITCLVTDDGSGFDVAGSLQNPSDRHIGLAGMADRVSMLHGFLAVSSAKDAGTSIVAKIPRWKG